MPDGRLIALKIERMMGKYQVPILAVGSSFLAFIAGVVVSAGIYSTQYYNAQDEFAGTLVAQQNFYDKQLVAQQEFYDRQMSVQRTYYNDRLAESSRRVDRILDTFESAEWCTPTHHKKQ